MKKLVMIVILLLVPVVASAGHVDGYWKDTNRDGVKDVYVQPHEATVHGKPIPQTQIPTEQKKIHTVIN